MQEPMPSKYHELISKKKPDKECGDLPRTQTNADPKDATKLQTSEKILGKEQETNPPAADDVSRATTASGNGNPEVPCADHDRPNNMAGTADRIIKDRSQRAVAERTNDGDETGRSRHQYIEAGNSDHPAEDAREFEQAEIPIPPQRPNDLCHKRVEEHNLEQEGEQRHKPVSQEVGQFQVVKERNARRFSCHDRRMNDLEETIRNLTHENSTLKHNLARAHDNERSYRSTSQTQNQALKDMLIKQQTDWNEDRNLCIQLETEKREIDRKYGDLERKYQFLVCQVRIIQDKELGSMESARYMPESHSEIEQKLSRILNDIKRWSKVYSLEHLRISDLERLLRPRGCLGPEEKLLQPIMQEDNAEGHAVKVQSWVFLSSAIAADVFQQIVADPFFAFHVENPDEEQALLTRDAKALHHLLRVIEQDDEAGACAWRCSLMRLLDPAGPSNETKASSLRGFSATFRASAAKRLAEQTVDDLLDVMISRKVADTATADLIKILQGCADISWKLWAQKTRLIVQNLEAMVEAGKPPTYHDMSDRLEIHSLHNKAVSDDAAALNGREVLLLTSPLVIIAGTTDGKDYHVGKVLKKAVAWMG